MLQSAHEAYHFQEGSLANESKECFLNWESSASFHSYSLNNCKLDHFLEQPCLL